MKICPKEYDVAQIWSETMYLKQRKRRWFAHDRNGVQVSKVTQGRDEIHQSGGREEVEMELSRQKCWNDVIGKGKHMCLLRKQETGCQERKEGNSGRIFSKRGNTRVIRERKITRGW